MISRIGLNASRTIKPSLALSFRGFKTIPQPPGHIVGTVNDAYIPPPANKLHGSLHWTTDRIVAVSLLPLLAAPIVGGSTSLILDSALSGVVLYHSYVGFQACIIDYIPTRVYGSYHNFAMYLLTAGTGLAAYGVYEIETKEGGLYGIFKKLWNA